MKRLALILLVVFTSLMNAVWASEVGIANAPKGLTLRAGPSRTQRKITSIPLGSKLIILDENGPEETIEGKKDRWVRIAFGASEGWAFGGFIQREGQMQTPLPSTNNASLGSNQEAIERMGNMVEGEFGSKEKVFAKFGKPVTQTAGKKEESPNGPECYLITEELTYPEFKIEFTSVTDTTESNTVVHLTDLNVGQGGGVSFMGITLGSQESEVTQLLGAPTESKGNILVYQTEDWVGDNFEFTVQDGKIIQMRYYTFLD